MRRLIYGRFAINKEDLDEVNETIRCVFEDEEGLSESGGGVDEFVLSALVFAQTDGTNGITADGADGCDDGRAGQGLSDGHPAGAGRLLFDGVGCEIKDVAVLPDYRGRGYGDFLVRLLADRALSSGARTVWINALAGTEDFFARIGFATEGEAFSREGARWQPMRLAGAFKNCDGCEGRISL